MQVKTTGGGTRMRRGRIDLPAQQELESGHSGSDIVTHINSGVQLTVRMDAEDPRVLHFPFPGNPNNSDIPRFPIM